MSDNRYLDGDPADVGTCFRDTSDFIASVAQTAALCADLLDAGNVPDAKVNLLALKDKARRILADLEKPELPECDVVATRDTMNRAKWIYKTIRNDPTMTGDDANG